MIRHFVPALLVATALSGAACAAPQLRDDANTVSFASTDDDKADNASADTAATLPECASPLMRDIFAATANLIGRGSIPASHYVTERNAADAMPLIDGPEIFPAFRELIASAQHHVVLQTYIWESGSDPANDILEGLVELDQRRALEAPDAGPVMVRFMADASRLGFGSSKSDLEQLLHDVESLHLDPNHVDFELAGFFHLAFGNLHVKTLVVDGYEAILTGANPEAHHNDDAPWRDAGYRFHGDVALALLADFDNAWRKAKPCFFDNADFYCEGATTDGAPQTYHVGDHPVGETACVPMMVVTRAADANPFSNRTDNTQDQAFLAAFGHAARRIRLQTPNLNDDDAKEALLDAVRRGVEVDILLSREFNDSSENLPGQGGTNQENVDALYEELANSGIENACDLLRVRWYSHDGVQAVYGMGTYASHAKYASIDESLAIVGTANMDTQSWNNSREVDVVVDSQELALAWDARLFVPEFERALSASPCAR